MGRGRGEPGFCTELPKWAQKKRSLPWQSSVWARPGAGAASTPRISSRAWVLGSALRAPEHGPSCHFLGSHRVMPLLHYSGGPRSNPGKHGAGVVPPLTRREPKVAEAKGHLRAQSWSVGLTTRPGPPMLNSAGKTWVSCLRGFLRGHNASGERALQRDPSLREIKRRASPGRNAFSTRLNSKRLRRSLLGCGGPGKGSGCVGGAQDWEPRNKRLSLARNVLERA